MIAEKFAKKKKIICDVQGTLAFVRTPYIDEQEAIAALEFNTLWNSITYAKYKDGIIVIEDGLSTYYTKNDALIAILENAQQAGYNVEVATGGYANVMMRILRRLDLPTELTFVDSKRSLKIAPGEIGTIIDDEPENSFVASVLKTNNEIKYFSPQDTVALAEHLGVSVLPSRSASL